MLKSMYMSIGIPPELRKALMELELELTRCGVPLVGIIAAPDAVSGANVLVVVRGRAEEWVEKVAEAKLKVDRRLGDTGILPAVVSESSRKVEAFLRAAVEEERSSWRRGLREFTRTLVELDVPVREVLATSSGEVVSGANVLVVVRGRAEEWVEKVAEAKLKVDRRLGDTGILPAVVSESSRKVEAFRLAGAARVAGDVDVSQEGAEPHEAG